MPEGVFSMAGDCLWFLMAAGPCAALITFLYLGFLKSFLPKATVPCFDLNPWRLFELVLSTLLMYVLFAFSAGFAYEHIHISHDPSIKDMLFIVAPLFFHASLRLISFFESSRIARNHLHLVVGGSFLSSVLHLAANLVSLTPDTSLSDAYIQLFHDIISTNIATPTWVALPIVTIFAVVSLELILYLMAKIGSNGGLKLGQIQINIAPTTRRLIELNEELPVDVRLYSSKKRINSIIEQNLAGDPDRCSRLDIVTNTFTVITRNEQIIRTRLNHAHCHGQPPRVRIIGTNLNILLKNKRITQERKQEIEACLNRLASHGAVICYTNRFDEIRAIIDGNRQAIASFSSGNYKGSDIAFYSEHPMAVAFLKMYFNNKCSRIKNSERCNMECMG